MTKKNQNTQQARDVRFPSGFTLIEVILALAIAAVLLGLVFSLYLTVSRTVEDQGERRTGRTAMMYALDRLARDLSSAQPVPGYEAGGFLLETEDAARGPVSRIVFCTARSAGSYVGEASGLFNEEEPQPGEQRDMRWFEILEVSYWLEYEPRGRGRLIRTERPLVGPGALEPARTNVLAVGIDQFEVRIRGQSEWVDEWKMDPSETEAEWPRAARITLVPDQQVRGAIAQTVDILIPTGWVIDPAHRSQ